MSGWKRMTLQEAGVQLFDCEHKTPTPCAEGYPYIAIPQLKSGHIDISDARRISKEDHIKWTRKAKPQIWDVILSRRCNPGETAVVPEGLECSLGQNLVLLRSNGQNVFPPFLRWLTRSPEWWEQIQQFLNVGAVFDSLRCADVPNFKLSIPPLPTQRRIASILGSLDDKIELNRRMNATLEDMARALFQSWFVDFDPVHAKAQGKQPVGMDAETAALFPDRFEDSTLGPIPAGWRVGTIKEIASRVQYGFTTSANNEPLGPKLLRITDIRGGMVDWKNVPYCDASDDDLEKYRIGDGDIFVARTGASTGENIYMVDPPVAVFASYLVRFQFAERGYGRIVGQFMRSSTYFDYVKSALGGSAQPNANAQTLSGASMVIPPIALANKLFELLRPLDLHRSRQDKETRSLAAHRDTLLPRLVSGELRVPDAERIVERASNGT